MIIDGILFLGNSTQDIFNSIKSVLLKWKPFDEQI